MPDARTDTRSLDLVWPDGRHAPLRLAPTPFAEGGDARLFDVVGRTDLVAKMYRYPAAEPYRRAKLDAMLASPPAGVTAEHEEQRSVQLAWPVALVEAGGVADAEAPLGFVMPRVDLDRAVDLELLLSARGRRAASLTDDYRTRVSVAHNLAAVVASLHAAGDHVIDLKPANVHVHRGTFFVAMLDCDGFSIGSADGGSADSDSAAGGARFPAHQYTDGYIAPEALRARAQPEVLGEAQDRFALAVVLFQLLSGGYHPFQGVPRPGASVPTTDGERVAASLYPYARSQKRLTPPPRSLYPAFDPATRSLFGAAFDGATAERPSAQAWQRHLCALLDDVLRPCPNDSGHARFGDRPCQMCQLAATRDAATAAPISSTSAARPVAPSATPAVPSGARSFRNILAAVMLRTAPTFGSGALAGSSVPSLRQRTAAVLRRMPLAVRLAAVAAMCFAVAALTVLGLMQLATVGPDLQTAVASGQLSKIEQALDRGEVAVWSGGSSDFGSYGRAYAPLDEEVGLAPWTGTQSDMRPGGDGARLGHLKPVFGHYLELPAAEPHPLHLAVWMRSPSAVALLVDAGMPINAYSGGRTALMLAATSAPVPNDLSSDAWRRLAQLRDLIADGGIRGSNGALPEAILSRADVLALTGGVSEAQWSRVLPYTLRRAYTDGEKRRARTDAAQGLVQSATIVQILIDSGAELTRSDPWGRRALAYAAASGNVDAVRQLLDAGADPNAADAAGITPLMMAADQAANETSDRAAARMAAVLLAGGADPDLTDGAGRRAAAYVGERPETMAGKRFRYVSKGDTSGFAMSRTLARLSAASRGMEMFWGVTQRVAAPDARADIGDGPTQRAATAGAPRLTNLAVVPWAAPDARLRVTCPGAPLGTATVRIRMERLGTVDLDPADPALWGIAGRVARIDQLEWTSLADSAGGSPSPGAYSACADALGRQLAGAHLFDLSGTHQLFDVRDEPERWPVRTMEVDIVARRY